MNKKIDATKVIFIIYCLILTWIILFKTSFSFSDIHWFEGVRRINVIPFYYADDVGKFHLREVVMNVIAFVPFGFYAKMLGITAKRSIIIGFLTSLIFELSQFILNIGAADITDIITNTLGAFAGICLYLLIKKIFVNETKIHKIINIMATVVISLFLLLVLVLFINN